MENSNTLLAFFFKPFFIGLYFGLIGCIAIYFRMMVKIGEAKKELKKLKEHLHTKLEIDSEANEDRKDKIETLKEENANLRVTVQTLNNKPGRKEVRQFYVYQKALDIMLETAPGFAPAWHNALREGEAAVEKVDKGILPFMKKISSGGSSEPPAELADKSGE